MIEKFGRAAEVLARCGAARPAVIAGPSTPSAWDRRSVRPSQLILPALDVEQRRRRLAPPGAPRSCRSLVLAAVIAWSVAAPLPGAVIGAGQVKVDLNRKTVQHQEGGIVGEILVRDGAKVKAGQPLLILLKDVRVDASNELVRTQLDAELAKSARLSAEQSGMTGDRSAGRRGVARSADPRVARAAQERERALRCGAMHDRPARSSPGAGTRHAGSEIQASRSAQGDDVALKHHRDELSPTRSSQKEGFIGKTRLIAAAHRGRASRGARERGGALSARAAEGIRARAARGELRSQFKQEAANELRQTTAAIFDLRERLRPAQDASSASASWHRSPARWWS